MNQMGSSNYEELENTVKCIECGIEIPKRDISKVSGCDCNKHLSYCKPLVLREDVEEILSDPITDPVKISKLMCYYNHISGNTVYVKVPEVKEWYGNNSIGESYYIKNLDGEVHRRFIIIDYIHGVYFLKKAGNGKNSKCDNSKPFIVLEDSIIFKNEIHRTYNLYNRVDRTIRENGI